MGSQPGSAGQRPVPARERIDAVDTIRGVSLLGILLMNILSFSTPGSGYGNPLLFGTATTINLWTWLVEAVLFEGKMRAIFSMLFGAGLILMTSRAEARGGGATIADIWLRRCLWLLLFGTIHTYFIWDGDILFPYAVCGLLLYPFRKLSPRSLIALSLVLIAGTTLSAWLGEYELKVVYADTQLAAAVEGSKLPLTGDLKRARDHWQERLKEIKPPKEETDRITRENLQNYRRILERRINSENTMLPAYLYHEGIWDALCMMFFGMALLKLGVLSAERSNATYLWMIAIGYGAGVPLRSAILWRRVEAGFDLWSTYPAAISYDLLRLVVSCGHIGLVMLICRKGWLSPLLVRLAAVGQMALSNYLTHSLVCTTLFYGYGLAWYARFERYQLYYIVAAIWLFQLTVSPIWLRYFLFGPVEWLWRSLTYWQPQPMRRAPRITSAYES